MVEHNPIEKLIGKIFVILGLLKFPKVFSIKPDLSVKNNTRRSWIVENLRITRSILNSNDLCVLRYEYQKFGNNYCIEIIELNNFSFQQ